jgi:surface protein
MRKMVKFASLCLAATLSMTTVLTAVPQNVRTVMAEESEIDTRDGGTESFEGNADTLHYAYDSDTKTLTLTGKFSDEDVFELLDDYIDFNKTPVENLYVNFEIDSSHITFRTGIFLGMEGEQIGDTRVEKLFNNISFGDNFINTMNRLKSFEKMFAVDSGVSEHEPSGFKNIDLSKFNTSNVTDMSSMFSGCKYTEKLDLSKFDTSKVIDMSGMFSGCSDLKTIDLSKFNTSEVTNMSGMFGGCSGLKKLDVSNFDTSKVANMSYMFKQCSELTNINVDNFDTKNVEDMSEMFYLCTKLTELDLSTFDMASIVYLYRMADDTYSLKKLNMGFKFPENVSEIVLNNDGFYDDEEMLHMLITPYVTEGEENKTISLYWENYDGKYDMCDKETHVYAPKKYDKYGELVQVIDIDSKNHEYIIERNHEFNTTPHDATCTEKGTSSICTICGEKIGTDSEALGHILGETVIENRVEPTYDKEGGYDEVVYCTRDDNGCGHSELSRKHVVLEKLKKPESTDDKKDDSKKDESTGETKPSSTASTKTTYADGLNQINGEWVYCKNNKIDTSYTGLCKYNGSWWYVKNGKVDFSATTLCKYNGSWFYVSGGKVNFNYTGLCKYNGSWFYVSGGKVNFSYTGLCKYNGSWWYVKNGQVDFKTTGLCKYNGAWWYVKGGKVSFTTTLCKYNGTWWYIKNGKVDFSSTTLCKYGNAWYCVSGGKVAWNYTGLCKYGSAWYYVQKGVVNFKATTLTKYAGTWWYVRNGVLNTSTTLCKYGNSWFAVSGGKVAWGYSGTMKYNGGTYNVVNGIVKF